MIRSFMYYSRLSVFGAILFILGVNSNNICTQIDRGINLAHDFRYILLTVNNNGTNEGIR